MKYTLKALIADGRALIVSWIGLPDVDYPTDRNTGYELDLKNCLLKMLKLYQYPVKPLQAYVLARRFLWKNVTTNTYDLNLTLKLTLKQNLSSSQTKKGDGLSLTVDTENGRDRPF